MIAIVDYGVGNLGSIRNMFKRVGIKSVVSSAPEELRRASKLLLPGVGSFDYGMSHLNASGLRPLLTQMVCVDRVPILGICLGMQLFTLSSEEGTEAGLGWLDARTIRFRFPPTFAQLKVPHMGWSDLEKARDCRLLTGLPIEARAYFVHSYHVQLQVPQDAVLTSSYGHKFVSAVEKDNILGVQFHPEKSHRFGMTILWNFANLY